MKILVFSDSHGNLANMKQIIEMEHPDQVLHLGDCVSDVWELERQMPGQTITYVRGNCDGLTSVPEVLTPVVEGKKIFMTHGHRYGVKRDFASAVWAAGEAEADILLFGHTHEVYAQEIDGLWVMNPGSCRGWGPATYGVILLENGTVLCYTNSI